MGELQLKCVEWLKSHCDCYSLPGSIMEDLPLSHDLVIQYEFSIHDSFELNEGFGTSIDISFDSTEGVYSSSMTKLEKLFLKSSVFDFDLISPVCSSFTKQNSNVFNHIDPAEQKSIIPIHVFFDR